MLKKWTLGCFFQCSLYDSHSYQSGEVRRGSVAYWSERRQGRVVGRFLSYNNTADYTLNPHTYTRTHSLVLCPCPSLVNVQFGKPGLWLSTHRRLMRFRTNRNTSKLMRMYWKNTKVGESVLNGYVSALGRRRNCLIAAWQFNKCQPAPPVLSLWWLAGVRVFITAVEKVGIFPAWHHI